MTGTDIASRTFDAVLLDLDGTLIDSTPSVHRCWRRWAAEYGVTLPAVLEHGLPSRTMVERYLSSGPLAGAGKQVGSDQVDAGARRIEALEIADTDGITPLPGARELLAALPEHRVAIVTSCTAPLAQARIAAAGLKAPPVVVTVDQLSRGKPDPEGYLLAASRLGVDPRRCVVLEDAPGGLAAGKAAGCATIALTTTTDPAALSAEAFVATPAQLRVEASGDGVRLRILG